MVYVSSDWHGISSDKIKALLNQVGFGAEDELFVLGDVIDRGEHGVDLLKHIMHEPNIKLIRGNHEQMLLSCAFLFDEMDDSSLGNLNVGKTRWLRVWQANGAEPTIAGLVKESFKKRQMILEYVEGTPLYATVSAGGKDFLLVHAGLGVSADGTVKKPTECSMDDFLWTRPSMETQYSTEFTTVLGHTPTCIYGDRYEGKILRTSTWINVDVGTALGHSPALLRLDDLKEFYLDER